MDSTEERRIINNNWIKYGALMAALAIVLDIAGDQLAAGRSVDETSQVATKLLFRTGVAYQLIHSLAIVAAGIIMILRRSVGLTIAIWLFFAGTLFFSGGSYAKAMTGEVWLEPFRLLGSVLLIGGWITLVEGACPGWESFGKRGATVEQDSTSESVSSS